MDKKITIIVLGFMMEKRSVGVKRSDLKFSVYLKKKDNNLVKRGQE
jgi:hypothetical protein